MDDYMPHLIETTMCGHEQRTYTVGLGVSSDDLSDDEKEILAESEIYCREYERKETENSLNIARRDFEKLRDIPNMPNEAIDILRNWTTRAEDEECEGRDD